MQIDKFYNYKKEHERKVVENKNELGRLSALYKIIITESFERDIKGELLKRLGNAETEQRRISDKGIFSIWFYFRRLWKAEGKIEAIEDFLAYVNSIPEELERVSAEFKNLNKPKR